jgi:uncharacterized repeat protein (TIGR03803 family)
VIKGTNQMNTWIKKSFIVPLVAVAAGWIWEGHVWAQTLQTLYTFTAATNASGGARTNMDGAYPTGLILSESKLYGTAYAAGNWGSGTVFTLNLDGTGYTVLHAFNSNSDGGCAPDGVVKDFSR